MPDLSNFKADHDHSDDDGVKWLPPWSLAARGKWAEAHPWLAGFYFGLFFGLFFGLLFGLFMPILFAGYVAIPKSVRVAVLVGGLTWVVSGPLFALALKRRWFQRLDAENVDVASVLRRPWSRLSDRMLSWYIWIFAFSAIVSVSGLVTGPARVNAAFTLGVSLLILATTWAERRRRRTSP
ncbi:MAG: hypothetical protein ACRD1T_13830 [Acidimicrobiia bacterium]